MTAEFNAKELNGRRSGAGWQACCPTHQDHDPSLSIATSPRGDIFSEIVWQIVFELNTEVLESGRVIQEGAFAAHVPVDDFSRAVCCMAPCRTENQVDRIDLNDPADNRNSRKIGAVPPHPVQETACERARLRVCSGELSVYYSDGGTFLEEILPIARRTAI